mmetsp:Transcript_50491/g.68662  ORF Transcript_50491/g.68662 Transcript_50491/m.68662 type:complete len:442 (-) Transcript_50491:758-2083(-)
MDVNRGRGDWDPPLPRHSTITELTGESARLGMPSSPVMEDFLRQEEREEYVMQKGCGDFEGWQPISHFEAPASRLPSKSRAKFSTGVSGEDTTLGFLSMMFRFKNTAFQATMMQVIVQLLNVLTANLVYSEATKIGLDLHFPQDVQVGFSLIGAPLAFLLVTRVKQAYTNFIEGRKSLGEILNYVREVAQLCYCHKRSPDTDPDIFLKYQRELRRRMILTVCLMRQALRESREGFIPGSSICGKPFDENWHLDPCTPAIGNVMSTEEKLLLQPLHADDRVFYMLGELKGTANILSEMLVDSDFAHYSFMMSTFKMSNAYSTCFRVVELDVPFPYFHLCYFLVFLYVFLTPWIQVAQYSTTNDADIHQDFYPGFSWGSSWVGCIILCTSYYCLLEIAVQLQNPFGHDGLDLDLEILCKRAHSETLVIAEITGSGDTKKYNYT